MLQLIPASGVEISGEAAEVWQSPLLGGEQSHKGTSWPPQLTLSPPMALHCQQCLVGAALGFLGLSIQSHPPHLSMGLVS